MSTITASALLEHIGYIISVHDSFVIYGKNNLTV